MSDLTLIPVDDVWLRVDATPALLRELADYFTFQAPGSQFMRRQAKFRGWDGRVRLFKLRTQTIYRGLAHRVLEWAEQRDYTVTNTLPDPDPFLPAEALDLWLDDMDLPFPIRDYQREALRFALDHNRGIIVSPTGSGKSFIIYLLAAALSAPKTLIIVPTLGLVQQMVGDFVSYGCDAGLIHTIQGGKDKNSGDCPYVVSTWQSIYDMEPSWYRQFGCVVCDEVHLAKAKSLTGLMEKCDRVPYKFGFTGTINDTQAHRLILEGLFGEVMKTTSTVALVKRQELAPLHVKMIVLEYPEGTRKSLRRSQYQDEVDFIVGDPARIEFVAQMVAKFKGNTLVLFTLIDKHGKQLYERIRQLCPGKRIHFVTGSVEGERREEVRQQVESDESQDQVIVASFGVFSTGINLRRLHHLVFASAGKSKIRTLQSIGRGLRTHASKSKITIYDIVDDLRIGRRENYSWRHAAERAKLYASEKFPVTLHQINMEQFTQTLSPGVLGDTPSDDQHVGRGETGVVTSSS